MSSSPFEVHIQPTTTSILTIGKLANHFSNVSSSSISFINWLLVENTEQSLKFIYFDKELINGIQVARSITINTDHTWQVKIHGTDLNCEIFSNIVAAKLVIVLDLDKLLHTIGIGSILCPGCDNKEFDHVKPCVDQKGKITGKLETMSNSQLQTFQIIRSTSCQYLVTKNCKSVRCQSCSKLNIILCNSLYKSKANTNKTDKEIQKSKSSSTSNWRFLSDAEKMKRCADQHRRIINAERREKYAKKKREEEKKNANINKK